MQKTLYNNNPKISIADVDKDGYKDIVVIGNDGGTSVILGTSSSQYADQTFPLYLDACYQIKTADIYNTGGIALLISNVSNNSYDIKVIPPVYTDPKPAPPEVKKDFQIDGSVYRPKLILYNSGERDFSYYQIWKKGLGQSDYSLYVNNVTSNEYIDYSEYIVNNTDGQEQGYDNCFYKVKSVDATSNVSDFSNNAGYRVGNHGCLYCDDVNSDKLGIGKKRNIDIPNYSITNFPNPFNPVTKIVYAIPNAGNVKITVYNSLGQIVKELVNEFKNAGNYLVEFNATYLSSGIYFYKIEAGSFMQVKRMILLK